MIYLLDTNVCVTYLRGKDVLLMQRVTAQQPTDVGLCSVVLAELYYGAALSNQPTMHKGKVQAFVRQFRSLPFDDQAADVFGGLRAHLVKLGTPIGPYDLMVAAIALARSLTVVTHNTNEFNRVPGLPLADWQIP
jgi:tRNA(fMet)-specific endonuclease VapC